MDEFSLLGSERELVKDTTLAILRQTFYRSERAEREYLSKLSRTYTLLFVLKNEPRIVEYFRQMSSNFVLYIGSDLLIRAISEYFLADQDRFKILQAAGATLILTEKTLEEVISHLRATDYEFRYHYLDMEPYVDIALARHIDRILIRSYFYARHDDAVKRKPTSWGNYVGMFCTYQALHGDAGKESLGRDLCEEFGFTYESSAEMARGVDQDELETLKNKIVEIRGEGRRKDQEETLSYNDALQVLRIYAKRCELGEQTRANPFGDRTWWLTQEAQVRKATPETVRKNNALYIMRPEFVLNFIALAPSMEAVRRSFGAIFPSLLGVRLSNRLRSDVSEKVMEKIREASALGDARARTLASELSDKLKGDQFRRYEVEFKTNTA